MDRPLDAEKFLLWLHAAQLRVDVWADRELGWRARGLGWAVELAKHELLFVAPEGAGCTPDRAIESLSSLAHGRRLRIGRFFRAARFIDGPR